MAARHRKGVTAEQFFLCHKHTTTKAYTDSSDALRIDGQRCGTKQGYLLSLFLVNFAIGVLLEASLPAFNNSRIEIVPRCTLRDTCFLDIPNCRRSGRCKGAHGYQSNVGLSFRSGRSASYRPRFSIDCFDVNASHHQEIWQVFRFCKPPVRASGHSCLIRMTAAVTIRFFEFRHASISGPVWMPFDAAMSLSAMKPVVHFLENPFPWSSVTFAADHQTVPDTQVIL
ncbi:hypothetical protein CLF_111073 [Clonorchis sinensis]|uniref:Uncharacterized protein n=1 Tax=Clonorchis sinensis TaxID=79923 RepID=G7YUB0_CLOSI|nr:hypothetical protein CLF_111073 [Clonorchis sinensis]